LIWHAHKKINFLIALVLLYLLVPTSHFAISIIEGTVIKVADGDTITVLDYDNYQHRVRIAGIDPTEKGQPFGNASRKRRGELVARKEVRVEF
jgi:micrococcal nuclease